MSDPRGTGTIQIELNQTLAELLARLCVLLDLAQRTRRQGGRLCFVTPNGDLADVVI